MPDGSPHLPVAPTTIPKAVPATVSQPDEFIRLLLASSPDCIKVLDLAGNLLSLSENGQKLLEIDDLSPYVGSCWSGWWLGDDSAKAAHAVAEAQAGRVGRFEAFAETAKGTPKWWDVIVAPMFGRDGRPEQILSISRDITERMAREAESRASHEEAERNIAVERNRLTEVIRLSSSFVAVLHGPEHVFELVNEQYQRLVGRRELLGKTVRQALPEVEGQGFFERLDSVYATGEPFVGSEMRVMLQRVAGEPLSEAYIELAYQPLRGADGSVTGIFAHGIDVTEHKKLTLALIEREEGERSARLEAERASLVKDEFLATLSHELRTPLSAILGWAQILRRGEPKPATLAEGLSTIERNARVQTQIIDDLLDMSRIISGKISLDAQRIDLSNVVRSAIDTVRPTAAAKGVEIVYDARDGDRHPILGDFNRLQQVFWNLFTNAVKFTPRGGLVQVRIDQRHSQWQVDVTDSGEGISEAFLPHVFDRFRQADASTTRKHGGLGLGLAIVKQLAELHGGSARVRSAGSGKGSTFTISLPVSVIHEGTRETTQQRREALAQVATADLAEPATREGVAWDAELCDVIRGAKVLIIDDEEDARVLLQRLFEQCGVEVLVAHDADEVIRLIQSERPDVMVSDIGMPEVDGYELMRRVRALDATAGGMIPAIALTAFARAEDRVKAVRAGFQTHVPKPVEPAELIAMVASLVRRG